MKDDPIFDWLVWFWQNADFGPAHEDVMVLLEEQYENETGQLVPADYSYRTQ